jgi:dethiobiotin synthase
MNIFITGTDTDVGKTTISAWLCMHTGVNYWKPIQTGSDVDGDVIRKFSPHTEIMEEVYKLKTPLSPYDAAKLENVEIDKNLFVKNLQNTVIEGAGGAFVPIAKNFLMVDLMKTCASEILVLIVAKSRLGMINHLLMTVKVLEYYGLNILGIIINGKVENGVKCTIEEFSKSKVLAVIPHSNHLHRTLESTRVPSEILEVLR